MTDTLQFQGLRGELKENEPMSRHSSWRAGGPAGRFYAPADLEDLSVFLGQLPPEEPILFVGLGSNLLVREGGWRGTVVLTYGPGRAPRMDDGLVYAAGEAPIAAADGGALAAAIRKAGAKETELVSDIARMPEAIHRAVRAGDVVLTMGAGSIGNVAGQLH